MVFRGWEIAYENGGAEGKELNKENISKFACFVLSLMEEIGIFYVHANEDLSKYQVQVTDRATQLWKQFTKNEGGKERIGIELVESQQKENCYLLPDTIIVEVKTGNPVNTLKVKGAFTNMWRKNIPVLPPQNGTA